MHTRILAVSAVVMILAGGIAVLAKQESAESAQSASQAAGLLPLPRVEPELPPAPPAQELEDKALPTAPAKWHSSTTEKPATTPSSADDRADPTDELAPPRQSRFTFSARSSQQNPSADPLQTVDSFVARNRREADEAIRQLNSEAKELRDRLNKVESALARWQKISRALDQQTEDMEDSDASPHERKLHAVEPAESPK